MRMLKLKELDPEISKYFRSMVEDTVSFRERNNVNHSDFMQLLIQIKNQGKLEEEHGYMEQICQGNLEDKSGDNGMYLPNKLQINKHIHFLE
jgi:cytochrome P450 family 6